MAKANLGHSNWELLKEAKKDMRSVFETSMLVTASLRERQNDPAGGGTFDIIKVGPNVLVAAFFDTKYRRVVTATDFPF